MLAQLVVNNCPFTSDDFDEAVITTLVVEFGFSYDHAEYVVMTKSALEVIRTIRWLRAIQPVTRKRARRLLKIFGMSRTGSVRYISDIHHDLQRYNFPLPVEDVEFSYTMFRVASDVLRVVLFNGYFLSKINRPQAGDSL